jgi:hypothetical protein
MSRITEENAINGPSLKLVKTLPFLNKWSICSQRCESDSPWGYDNASTPSKFPSYGPREKSCLTHSTWYWPP